jgi:hypothetical protein
MLILNGSISPSFELLLQLFKVEPIRDDGVHVRVAEHVRAVLGIVARALPDLYNPVAATPCATADSGLADGGGGHHLPLPRESVDEYASPGRCSSRWARATCIVPDIVALIVAAAFIVIGLTWIAAVKLENPFVVLYASLFFSVLGGGVWLIRGTKGPAPRNGDHASW